MRSSLQIGECFAQVVLLKRGKSSTRDAISEGGRSLEDYTFDKAGKTTSFRKIWMMSV
jgi:hypothetical protein